VKRMTFDSFKKQSNQKTLDKLLNPEFSPEFRNEIERISETIDNEEMHAAPSNKSYYKVVTSGHIVEIYKYEEGVKTGTRHKRPPLYDPETGEITFIDPKTGKETPRCDPETGYSVGYNPEIAKRHNARRAKNEFRRLVISNFTTKSKFVTLTFRDGSVADVKDVRECNHEFKKFIQRLRRRFGNFKYVKVIEFQDSNDRGAVHYHMMSDLPYIDNNELAGIWGHGYIGINRIDHVDNLGAYMMKYMVKDFNDDRLSGEKAYTASKNLIRPIVSYGHEAVEIAEIHMKNKKEVFTSEYESEYQGQIIYKEYNLQRNNK
jgi:hypothetical protein